LQLVNEKKLNWSNRTDVLSMTIILYLARNFMYVLKQQSVATRDLPLADQIGVKRQAVENSVSHAFEWHTGCKHIVVLDSKVRSIKTHSYPSSIAL
jgi:hypothetical protein